MKDVDIVVTATFTGKVSFRVSDKFAKEMEELIQDCEFDQMDFILDDLVAKAVHEQGSLEFEYLHWPKIT